MRGGRVREVDFLRGGVDAALVSRSAASPPRYPALLLHFPQPFLMFPQRIQVPSSMVLKSAAETSETAAETEPLLTTHCMDFLAIV